MMFQKLLIKIKEKLNLSLFDEVDDIVMYICGNESLPSPLEPEEEQVLIEELANDNKQAKEKLIEHNLRLVVYIAKKFENTGMNIEDLFSIGSIGLIKAVQTYNLNKQIKLATYASRCIENEILMQLRKLNKIKNEVSLDESLNSDSDGNELLLEDVLYNEDENVASDLEKSAEKEILWNIINKLNSREKEIMLLRFGLDGKEEKTQKEVADMLGISQSYISRIEKKILGKMKKDLDVYFFWKK